MAIKHYKPTTNGRRNMTGYDFSEITTNKPEKTLLESKNKMLAVIVKVKSQFVITVAVINVLTV